MQFIQFQIEFADHLAHHVDQELRRVAIEQPIQTAADAIIVQLAQLPLS